MEKIDFDDMGDRLAAYAGLGADDETPARWTPEQVVERLVEAFTVVHRTVGGVGPKGHGNGWPSMLREFHELIDEQTREQMERDAAEELRRRGARPSAGEIARADEAIAWCARYFAEEPQLADALQFHSFCKALDINMAKILRRRRQRADTLVARRQAEEDALRDRRRKNIAAGVSAWANHRLDGADAERATKIKANARIRFARELEAAGADVKPIRVKRSDVMPARVFTNQWLDQQRKRAAAALSAALHRDNVRVR